MTDIQFGIRRTWPDGHSEDSLAEDRTDAELLIRAVNGNPDNPARASLITRPIGAWVEGNLAAVTPEHHAAAVAEYQRLKDLGEHDDLDQIIATLANNPEETP